MRVTQLVCGRIDVQFVHKEGHFAVGTCADGARAAMRASKRAERDDADDTAKRCEERRQTHHQSCQVPLPLVYVAKCNLSRRKKLVLWLVACATSFGTSANATESPTASRPVTIYYSSAVAGNR